MSAVNLKKRFDAVQGYLELGMFDEALEELTALESEIGPRFEVLALRMTAYRAAHRWEEMREVAALIHRLRPGHAESWVWLADATRHSISLEVAREILRDAETAFPANPHVKFQLGCYHCQLGELIPAERCVREAIALDRRWHEIALGDTDVESLWPRLRELPSES